MWCIQFFCVPLLVGPDWRLLPTFSSRASQVCESCCCNCALDRNVAYLFPLLLRVVVFILHISILSVKCAHVCKMWLYIWNRSKLQRNENRDISEVIALGVPNPRTSNEVQYDQRLFNQSKVWGTQKTVLSCMLVRMPFLEVKYILWICSSQGYARVMIGKIWKLRVFLKDKNESWSWWPTPLLYLGSWIGK